MKKVFITGVSSGIGKALAEKYLKCHYAVYGVSRRTPEALMGHPNFFFKALDLKNVSSIPAELQTFLPAGETMDLVVLNAAFVGKIADVKDTSLAEFEELMRINVWSNKALIDTIVSVCSAVKQVVAISSCTATVAFRGIPAYCVSKSALNMLMALYAEEQNSTHFSAIAPGLVRTEMQDQIATDPKSNSFQALTFLKSMRSAGCMSNPATAADCFVKLFDDALEQKSGAYIDASRTFGKPSRFA